MNIEYFFIDFVVDTWFVKNSMTWYPHLVILYVGLEPLLILGFCTYPSKNHKFLTMYQHVSKEDKKIMMPAIQDASGKYFRFNLWDKLRLMR